MSGRKGGVGLVDTIVVVDVRHLAIAYRHLILLTIPSIIINYRLRSF